MKFLHFDARRTVGIALACVFWLGAAENSASTFVYTPRDLLLGFRRGGNTSEMVVNLGQASAYANATPGSVIPITQFTAEQLTRAFTVFEGIQWSVAGTTRIGDEGDPSVPEGTLYVTRGRTSADIQTTAWTRRSETSQGLVANRIAEYGGNAQLFSSSIAPEPVSNTDKVVLIPLGHPQSYGIAIGSSANFRGSFQGNIEKNTSGSFTQPVRSDLYELTPSFEGPIPARFLGFFELNPNGSMFFKAAGGVVPPGAPATLTATPQGYSIVSLRWSNVPSEFGFRVERLAPGGDWVAIASLPADVLTFVDSNLTPQTQYSYRVFSFNGDGESAPSVVATAETYILVRPAAPQLSISSATAARVNLNWTDTTNELGFVLERFDAGDWKLLATLVTNVQVFSDTNVVSWSEYFYRVKATNEAGASDYATNSARTTPPQPVMNLVSKTHNQLVIGWSNLEREDGYLVERRLSTNDAWEIFLQAPADRTTLTNAGLTPLTEYFFRVKGSNALGDTPYSPEFIGFTAPPPLVPPSIPSLTILSATSTEIGLSWSNPANESGFILVRTVGGGAPVEIARPAADVTAFRDFDLVPNTRYLYRIVAFNQDGFSGFSNEAAAETLPLAPALVLGEVSHDSVQLQWTPSIGVAGYRIERQADAGGPWVVIASTSGSSSQFVDASVSPEKTYRYRLRAFNSSGNSEPSSEVAATTKSAPSTAPGPVVARIQSVSLTEVVVGWDMAAGAMGYRVERSADSNAWVTVAELPSQTLSHPDRTVAPHSIYFYRVSATNTAGVSVSAPVQAETPAAEQVPSAPELGTGTIGERSISLRWNRVQNALGYILERTVGGDVWLEIARPQADTLTFLDENLSASTSYRYRLRAFNNTGESPNSAELAAATTAPNTPVHRLTATLFGGDQANLQWNEVPGDVSYDLQIRNGANGLWKTLLVLKNQNTFMVGGLAKGAKVSFRVRIASTSGPSSGFSPEAELTVPFDITRLELQRVQGVLNFRVLGQTGQIVKLQGSTNLQDWADLSSGTLEDGQFIFAPAFEQPAMFIRALSDGKP